MEIADVRGYALSSPIEPVQEREFYGGVRRLLKRDIVLVVIETPDGERGVAPAGASSSAMREYFEGESQATFADLIEREIAPLLEGTSVDQVEDIHAQIDAADLPERVQHEAVAALDVAFHDLLGKQTGTPIYELLSERFDTDPMTTIPMYASAGMYMEPEGYAKQADIIDQLGFFGYKYRPGLGPKDDLRTIDSIRNRVDDAEIMIDAHTWWKMDGQSYDQDTVSDIVEYAATRDAYWIEEPVAPDDYDGYADLSKFDVSLAGGESEESPDGLLALARTGAVDFLQGDVRHHRGYTGCSHAIEYCLENDVEFVPHNFGTWLGLTANAHLVAAAPDVGLLEYPIFESDPALAAKEDPGMYPFELAFDIINEEISVEQGSLQIPDEPGLGVTVDWDVIEEYPHIDGPWTEFIYHND